MNNIEEIKESVNKALECLVIGNRTFQSMDHLLNALGIIDSQSRWSYIGNIIERSKQTANE